MAPSRPASASRAPILLIWDRISLRVGDVIRPENVRAAIQALFDTGRYRTVEVDAVAADNGTALTFNVTPHYFFGKLTLIPESLLERPLSTLVRVPVGQKYSETQVQEIVAATKQILEEAGYFNVTLTVRSEQDDVHRLQNIELSANTDAKSKARISAINIEGSERNSPAIGFEPCPAHFNRRCLQRRRVLTGESLQYSRSFWTGIFSIHALKRSRSITPKQIR